MTSRRLYLLLLLTTIFAFVSTANAGECIGGVQISFEDLAAVAGDTVGPDLHKYAALFHDIAAVRQVGATKEPICDVGANGIALRAAFGARLKAQHERGGFAGFLHGGSASFAFLTGAILGARGELTPQMWQILRDIEYRQEYQPGQINSLHCGHDPDQNGNPRWIFGNDCMDDITVNAEGTAWRAAYLKFAGDDRWEAEREKTIAYINDSVLNVDKRICIYDQVAADGPRGPCNVTDISVLEASLRRPDVNGVPDETGAALLPLNHIMEDANYGIGLISTVANAFLALDIAGMRVGSRPNDYENRTDFDTVMEALFRQGQRSVRGIANPSGDPRCAAWSKICYRSAWVPHPDDPPSEDGSCPRVTAEQLTVDDFRPANRNRSCSDRSNEEYRASTYPVFDFYREYGFPTGNKPGFQFLGTDFPTGKFRNSDGSFVNLLGNFGAARYEIYYTLTYEWLVQDEKVPEFRSFDEPVCSDFTTPKAVVKSELIKVSDGTNAEITVTLSGPGPWDIAWSDGVENKNIVTPVFKRVFKPTETYKEYTITKVTGAGTCQGVAEGMAIVVVRTGLVFIDNDITVILGEPTTYKAKLHEVQGGAVPNALLIFKVRNREVGRAITDANGQASVSAMIHDLEPGFFADEFVVDFPGNALIRPARGVRNVTLVCRYSVSPRELNLTVDGDDDIEIIVNTTAECPWTPVSSAGWIMVSGGGKGPGTFHVTIPDLTGPPRSGTITVGDRTIEVHQTRECTFRLSPDLFYLPANPFGANVVDVFSPAGCAWTVENEGGWIELDDSEDGIRDGVVNGSGDAEVRFHVLRNFDDVRRNGKLIVRAKATGITADVADINQEKPPPATKPVLKRGINGGSVRDWQNVTMRVLVEGSPLEYKWYADGQLFREGDDPSLANLTIGPGQGGYPEDNGTTNYRVVVSNSKGSVESSASWSNQGTPGPCRVPMLSDSTFHTNDWPSDRNSNGNMTLTLRIFAEPGRFSPKTNDLVYEWFEAFAPEDGQRVGGNTDEVPVSPSGTAYYWVKVTDPDCGSNWSRTAEVLVTPPPPQKRRRAARHDFTGDNKADIFWHNVATGANEVWEMNGTSHITRPVMPNGNLNAQLQSIGDFDGDERTDLVWRDPSTGQNSTWLMGNWTFRGSLPLHPARSGAEWVIGAVADLDDDNNHDIIWHNGITGENEIWFQNGTDQAGTWALPKNPAGSWGLHGTADFNRDGRPDLFFHDRASGANSVWIMNDSERAVVTSNSARPGTRGNLSVTSHALPSMADRDFVPVQIDDMNNDGVIDIVWRNGANGDNRIWMMSSITTIDDDVELESRTDPNWQIGGGGSSSGGGGGSDSRTATSMTVVADPAAFNGATAITATLVAGGAPLSGRTVQFFLNGVEVGRSVTASDGTAATGASVAGIAAGVHSNAVTVSYAGDTQYTPSQASTDLVVAQAQPVLQWPTPAPIAYGTPLGASQLNATANVPGTFTYAPAAGAILDAGFNPISVTFTPSDATLATASKTVIIFVSPASVSITWPAPGAIAYGTPLSAAQLNATAGVSGTFTYNPPAGTILNTGTHTLQATFTPVSPNYAATTASRTIEVIQGAQTITWPAPATVTYGTPLSTLQLNATVSTTGGAPAGALTYTPALGTILPAGTHTLTATVAATQFYAAAAKSVQLIVVRANPVITWPAPSSIVYGTPLGAAQLNATANVAGTFVYSPAAGAILNAGSHTLSVQFTPADTNNYNSASKSVSLTVQKAKPVLTWSAPAAIVYGTPLGGSQLNATSGVAGAFVYSPAAGTILNAGAGQTLSVQFSPGDPANYESASAATSITVHKAPQTLSWASPGPIVYTTPLSATQLNATVSVVGPSPAGALAYNPPAGTVLQAGNAQVLTASAAATANYEPATLSVTIDVLRAKPVITWQQPAPIVYRTALSGAQLNATANVAGTFAYTPAAGTVLEAGMQTLSVHFTPSDTRNYEDADATVTLEVQQATPVLTWPQPAGIVYGTPLGATQLNATADVPGTFTYTPAAGTILDAGAAQTLSVELEPADARNFKNVSASVIIDVAKAPQTLSWATPAAIVYGTALSTTQLNATVSVVGPAAAGALLYLPAAGTVLDAGTHTLTVTAQETPNYEPATLSVSIAVTRAPLSLTVDAKSRLYGAALPPFTGTLTGVVNGDAITPSYATTATQQSGTGVYPITATLIDPANRLVNYDVTITPSTLTILPAPLVIAANAATKQYSDPLPQLTATFTGFVLGETPAVLGGTLVIQTAAAPLSAPGTYPITIGGLTSSNYAIVYVPSTLTVIAEDARVAIISPLSVATAATTATRVTLTATVKDISATPDAAADSDAGDIRNAMLAFVDRATGDTLCTAPIGLTDAGDARVGIATCTFTRNFPAGTSTLVAGARVGGYYSRDDAADDATLTVAPPTADFITGAGATSSGAFNVNLQYDKKGVTKGNFTFRYERATRIYEISASVVDTLAIQRTAGGGTASIVGTAVLRDVTTPTAPIVLDPAAPLIATATDDGEPSTRDTLSVTLLKSTGGFWLATNWNGERAVAEPLVRGNLAVHYGK